MPAIARIVLFNRCVSIADVGVVVRCTLCCVLAVPGSC